MDPNDKCKYLWFSKSSRPTTPVCCVAKLRDQIKVERSRRFALMRATCAISSTSTSLLEILSHATPIVIQREDVMMQEYLHIMRLPVEHHLRKLMSDLIQDAVFMDYQIFFPPHPTSSNTI